MECSSSHEQLEVRRPIRVSFFGGGFTIKNLGVWALTYVTVTELSLRLPETLEFGVFGHRTGSEVIRIEGAKAWPARCTEYGSNWSRRIHRSDSVYQIALMARLGGLTNRAARFFRRSDCVLDISGGDSFTDIYGAWRYKMITLVKRLTIRARKPLILLPQTYGPFSTPAAERRARQIFAKCRAVWSRDERSHAVVDQLSDDTARIRGCGVDLAFLLPSLDPGGSLDRSFRAWLSDEGGVLVGVNVSGMLYNKSAQQKHNYGLKASYPAVIHGLVLRLLSIGGVRLVLVPHVVTEPDHYESDVAACMAVAESLGGELNARVRVAPQMNDARAVKWIIGQTDWFCGTRMHSTIAAVSNGIPSAVISYSPKAEGVFQTCGIGSEVVDPKALTETEAVSRLFNCFERREQVAAKLSRTMPNVKQSAHDELDEVASVILESYELQCARGNTI